MYKTTSHEEFFFVLFMGGGGLSLLCVKMLTLIFLCYLLAFPPLQCPALLFEESLTTTVCRDSSESPYYKVLSCH